MSKWIPLFLILALLLPNTARGQEITRLSALEVDIWPEYDRPSVLVILHLTLEAEATLPADLSVRIPLAAGEPNAVAVRQPNGQLFSIDYQSQVSGETQIIQFATTLPEVQLEYYDPSLVFSDSTRTFTYRWTGDYAVDRMQVQVQQPPTASSLSITPGPVSSRLGGDRLTYFIKEIGAVAEGQTFTLEVSYQKSTDSLTVGSMEVQPSAPLSTAPTWDDRLRIALPWFVGALGVLLIVGGGYWFWKSGRQMQPEKRRRRSRAPLAASTQAAAEGAVYCHQCGKRAAPGDRFCRSCGTRLRVE